MHSPSSELGRLLPPFAVLMAWLGMSASADAQARPWVDVSAGWTVTALDDAPDGGRPADAEASLDLDAPWRDVGPETPRRLRARKTLRLPDDFDGDRSELAILVGPAGPGWYELRVDGETVGGAGDAADPVPYPRSHLFRIPAGATRDGIVEVELLFHRVPGLEGALDGGPGGGRVLLGDAEALATRMDLQQSRRLVEDAPALALVILFLAVAANHLGLYRLRPGEYAYLWFGLATLAAAANAWLTSSWFTAWVPGYVLAYRLGDAAAHLTVAFLVAFLWSVLDRRMGRPVRGYAWSHVALAILALVLPFTWVTASASLRLAWLVPGVVAALWILVRAARAGRREAIVLLAGGAVMIAAELLAVARVFGAPTPPGLPYLGLAVLVLTMSLVLSDRFARSHRRLRKNRDDLRELVRERTHQLAEATLDARNAHRSRSEFLSTMSHELRTPLNSVIGFSKILLSRGDHLDDRDRDFLTRIRGSGERLLELINDVLDLSKIEAGRLEVRPEPTDVRELVEGVVRKTKDEARRRSLALEVEGPPACALPRVWVDPLRLEEILLHLLENALKFTSRGTIRVRIVAADGRAEAVEVEDTGVGIPADRLERIFEPFEQGETSTARRYEGTGLGLSIARRLCELMDCTLEVRSREGRGTTFRVGLPDVTAPDLPGAEELEAAVDAFGEGSRTVLVIDDEEDARALLVELLRSLDCRPLTAASGVTGLGMARRLRPDLITLDLRMKGQDGWETLRSLKADPETRDIPVVVVSVIASESRGELLGPVDVVDKPVDREALEAAVRRNLDGRPSRVLVVDDDPDVRRMYETLLSGNVDEIRSAEDGQRALEILTEYDPGLILLDLVMPRMDGFTFLRSIREGTDHRNVPVVVVTSKDLSPDEIRALERSTAGLVHKDEGDALAALRNRLGSYLSGVG